MGKVTKNTLRPGGWAAGQRGWRWCVHAFINNIPKKSDMSQLRLILGRRFKTSRPTIFISIS